MTNLEKLKEYHRKTGATHYYSSQSVLPLLEKIYAKKRPQDEVILSKAHAITAQLLIENRLPEEKPVPEVYCSLGTAFPFVLGKAFMNPHIFYYLVMGDGEWQEGSNWEAFHLMERLMIRNVIIYVDHNRKQAMGDLILQAPGLVRLHKGNKGPHWTYHYKGLDDDS